MSRTRPAWGGPSDFLPSSTVPAAGSSRRSARGAPYRVGDAVVGDDPCNGRHAGIIMSHRGPSVELGAEAGVFFYDHRHLRPQD
ncbi:hypothetical protein AHiyo4_04560 [Arthrobacter sp. Hiyo4]|nr:hypothetical protein AHiyo4_04560 [Arthrobacter sp. Hiyo4]